MPGATPPCGKGISWQPTGASKCLWVTRKAVSRAILSLYQARNRMPRTGYGAPGSQTESARLFKLQYIK